MKKVSIVFNGSYRDTNGISSVVNNFLQEYQRLLNNSIELLYLYDKTGIVTPKRIDINKDKPFSSNINLLFCRIKTLINKFTSKSSVFVVVYIRYFLLSYFTSLRIVKNIIANDKSDVLIFHDPLTAGIYVRNKKKVGKVILVMHCGENYFEVLKMYNKTLYGNSWFMKYYEPFIKETTLKVDKLILLCENTFNYFSWVPKEKKIIIPNGIACISNSLDVKKGSTDKIRFVTVANLIPLKNHSSVIEAIALLSENDKNRMSYYIVGEGECKQELLELVYKLELSNLVFFLGRRSDVPEILQNMDVYISPSHTEGVPMSLLEALRAGLFILTTDKGGCRDVLSHETGMIIGEAPNDIYKSLVHFLRGRIDFSLVNIRSKELFNNKFSIDIMMDNYVKVIHSV